MRLLDSGLWLVHYRLKDEEASKEIESLAAKIQRVVEASRMRRTEQKRLDAQKSSIQTQVSTREFKKCLQYCIGYL